MHKRLPLSVASSLAVAALLTPNIAGALNIGDLELGIQPRLETGLMYYEFEEGATAFNVVDFQGASFSSTASKIEFKDTLPLVLGGITFFIGDRFFLDFSAQKAFNGNDSDTQSSSFISTDNSIIQARQTSLDADFDRTEYAISLGYAINRAISVFAGYKRAKTDFNVKGSGKFEQRNPPDPILPQTTSGIIETDANFDLKYDGPFVGVATGLRISEGFFKGLLSFNFAAAFLNSKVDRSVKQTFTISADEPLNPGVLNLQTDFDNKGDALGATFGINWRGLIKKGLIKQDDNLGYSINLNAYQYNFDADDSDEPNLKETAINFRVGISYVF